MDRVTTLHAHLSSIFSGFSAFDAIVLVMLIGCVLPRLASDLSTLESRWYRLALSSAWFIPIGFAVAILTFWTVIAPQISSGGALIKCVATMAPVIVIGGLVQLDRISLHGWVKLSICLMLVAFPATTVAMNTRQTINNNNTVGANAALLKPMLQAEQQCLGRPVVLMTRSPWEISQATGFPTVQIPNGSLSDILQVADRYGVTDIELTPVRSALSNVADLNARGVIAPSDHFEGRRIVRMRSTVGQPAC